MQTGGFEPGQFTGNQGYVFDSHAAFNHLLAGGYTKKQAEAQVEVWTGIIHSNLATKLDIENVRAEIENVRAELKTDIENVRTELKTEIKLIESKLTIRLGSMIVASTSILAILMKIL